MSIKLLESPLFEEIETNIKTLHGIKDFDKKQYIAWVNRFYGKPYDANNTDQNKLSWVANVAQDIFKFYYRSDTLKPSTKRIHCESLARVLLAIDKNKYREVARKIFSSTLKIQRKIDKSQLSQSMSDNDKKNYVPFTYLLNRIDELNHANMTQSENMILLSLAVNVLYPPLRLNWLNMNYHKSYDAPPENDTNYLWKYDGNAQPKNANNNFSKGCYILVINSDKIEKARQMLNKPRQLFLFPDNEYIQGSKLSAIFDQSFAMFPRVHVLISSNDINENMTASTYYNNIKLAVGVNGKNPKQNLLRKIYINHFHFVHRPFITLEQKIDIADRMRHKLVVDVIQTNYIKMDLTGGKNEPINKKVEKAPNTSKTINVIVPIKPKFNKKVYYDNYYKNHSEHIKENRKSRYINNKYIISRNRIIARLNNGIYKVPRASTIKKYNLQQYANTKKWF
jgi:hypothetical protein